MVHVLIMLLGIHTIATLNGSENYAEMKEGFAPVLEEINMLIQNRYNRDRMASS